MAEGKGALDCQRLIRSGRDQADCLKKLIAHLREHMDEEGHVVPEIPDSLLDPIQAGIPDLQNEMSSLSASDDCADIVRQSLAEGMKELLDLLRPALQSCKVPVETWVSSLWVQSEDEDGSLASLVPAQLENLGGLLHLSSMSGLVSSIDI